MTTTPRRAAGLVLAGLSFAAPARPQRADTQVRIEALEAKVRKLEQRGREESSRPAAYEVHWDNGLHFDSPDRRFRLKVGGRIHNDWAFLAEDGNLRAAKGDFLDGVEFRRARLYIQGMLYDRVEFKAQYDFAGGDADFKDVYAGIRHIPVAGGIRVGQFKEPFGLEELTSSNYITFMERSLVQAFVPSRNTGVMLHNHHLGDRLTWQAGVFKDSDSFGNQTGEGDYNYTVRLTGLPFYEDKGRRLVHLGVAYSRRNPNGGMLRLRERPEAHLAPRLVDTGGFAADGLQQVGLEGAAVWGPFSAQGEVVFATADVARGPDPSFFGFYVMGSFFVTGENRAYKKSSGTFARLRPTHDFLDGGWGALELAARYSHLDLDDGPITGGKLDDLTLGANWYLYPNTRLMANVVLADLDRVGDADMFLLRLQIDF